MDARTLSWDRVFAPNLNQPPAVIRVMSRKQEYEKYINSSVWKRLKEKALALNQSCVLCDSRKNLHVHHRRYPDVLGTEPVEWLTVLCRNCHNGYHKFLDQNKRGRKPKGGKGKALERRIRKSGEVKIYTDEELAIENRRRYGESGSTVKKSR